jgi:TM2 domain-containing membrane protein YozV
MFALKGANMDDSVRQQLLFEANRKSTGAAYLLWFFLGGFGAHRFYLGRTGSAVTQLLLLLLGWIPFFMGWVALGIWWIVDAFLIPDIIRVDNLRTIDDISHGRMVMPR